MNQIFAKNDISNYNSLIETFIEKYENDQKPIEVSFRDLVPGLKTDRSSHLIHTYPAKLLMHIPIFFLSNTVFSKPGDSVFDPFCGSGTVLLESLLHNRNAYGADANPLARLITKVKTSNYNRKTLLKYKEFLKQSFDKDENIICAYPDVVNIDYWFLPHVKNQLAKILFWIKSIHNKKYRDFYLVAFSNCVKKVSLADTRVSVPVRLKYEKYPEGTSLRKKNYSKLEELKTINVYEKFLDIIDNNIERSLSIPIKNRKKLTARVISDNAKKIIEPENAVYRGLQKGSIDLIITSPPYAGAQKYIRASSLNLGWTELGSSKELKPLDSLSIGRENYSKSEYHTLLSTDIQDADDTLHEIHKTNALRAHIAANYLLEMKIALKQSIDTLKKGGYFVLVAANNQVCGMEFKTQEYLNQIMIDLGLTPVFRLIDDIKSYGLMTKRNKTASVITREWVLVYKK